MKHLIKKIFTPLVFVVTVPLLLSTDEPSDRYFEITRNMEIFSSIYSEVNKYYVDEVDPNAVMQRAIDAMLEQLDPYTNYIPEDDIEDYRFLSTGQYGGIGATIGSRDKKMVVLMPYEGFPAYKAGLKIGDEIIAVDDKNVEGKSTSDVSKLLKGQAGTPVTVKVKRYGQKELLSFNLSREKIKVKNVPYYGMVNDNVGYIVLKDFTKDASKEVRKGLSDLKSQGATSIILDLRGNPGGLLLEAIAISNLFVPKGKEIVSTKGKVTKWNATHTAKDIPFDTQIPLAILTNSRSASASEIVSGVIQDYDRGVLIGKRTFGKGLVQATLPTAHKTQLKVTTAKYYIPSGRCIQAIDYSNRNDDGSVGKIPDSLKVAFKTSAGREVFDGGGIEPDLEVAPPIIPEIAIHLIDKGLIFDYATKYYYEEDSVASVKEFSLSDKAYEKFVDWLDEQKFDYHSRLEDQFDDFVAMAKEDTTLVSMEDEFRQITKKIDKKKRKELFINRDFIKELLEEEIAGRYYLERGVVESTFDNDVDIQAAINVFNNPDKYRTLLKQ